MKEKPGIWESMAYHFVFNNKYAVSGAQSPETFLEVLEQSWKEFAEEKPAFIVTEGLSCEPGGNCN